MVEINQGQIKAEECSTRNPDGQVQWVGHDCGRLSDAARPMLSARCFWRTFRRNHTGCGNLHLCFRSIDGSRGNLSKGSHPGIRTQKPLSPEAPVQTNPRRLRSLRNGQSSNSLPGTRPAYLRELRFQSLRFPLLCVCPQHQAFRARQTAGPGRASLISTTLGSPVSWSRG